MRWRARVTSRHHGKKANTLLRDGLLYTGDTFEAFNKGDDPNSDCPLLSIKLVGPPWRKELHIDTYSDNFRNLNDRPTRPT